MAYDLFDESRRDLSIEMERAERRRRLHQKFEKKKNKKKAIEANTWSVEDHRDYLMQGYTDKQENFAIFQRKMLCYPAFWSLTGTETKVLLLCCNEVSWKEAKKIEIKAKAGNGGCRKIELPREPWPFTIPLARLEAAGVSRKAAKLALKKLQDLGFIKKLKEETGKPSVYELSEGYQRLSSAELGGVKYNPPIEREKPVSQERNRRKPSIRVIK